MKILSWNVNALGDTFGGTTVNSGMLLLGTSGQTFTEPLTLTGGTGRGYGTLENYGGDNTWAGSITLDATSWIGTTFNNGNLTVSGPIGGPGGLTISSQPSSKVTLSGTNNYVGTTTVSVGTILIVDGSITSTATTTVKGILGGTGTIDGPVVVNSGGKRRMP